MYTNAESREVNGIVQRRPMLPTRICRISTTMISRFMRSMRDVLLVIRRRTKESEPPISYSISIPYHKCRACYTKDMNIYFSGIGGVGLGPLAEIARDAGHIVHGSDAQESLTTREYSR